MNGIAPTVSRSPAQSRRRRVCRDFLGGIERDRNRRWDFERAGNRHGVVANTRALQLGERAFQQRILDVVIKARLDDQRARPGKRRSGLEELRGARLPFLRPFLVLKSDRLAASRRMGYVQPWFETAQTRLLTIRACRVVGAVTAHANPASYFISDSRAA